MRAAAVGATALVLVLLSTASGQAHSQLVSSDPANGATLTVAPTSVTFTFDEALLPDLDTISINDASGQNVTSTRVEPVGSTLTTAWPTGLVDGTYQVAYRIVSGDGHPVTGAISFSYGTGTSAQSAAPTAPQAAQPSSGLSGTTLVTIAVIGGLVVAAGLAVMLVRRRR